MRFAGQLKVLFQLSHTASAAGRLGGPAPRNRCARKLTGSPKPRCFFLHSLGSTAEQVLSKKKKLFLSGLRFTVLINKIATPPLDTFQMFLKLFGPKIHLCGTPHKE